MKRIAFLATTFLFAFVFTKAVYSQNLLISGGGRFSVAKCDDGRVYSWGDNSEGQLGIGTTAGNRTSPGLVNFPDVPGKPAGTKPTIVAIDGGSGSHILALDCDGNVWTWGGNCEGQIGNGTGGRTVTQVQNNTGCSAANAVSTPTLVLRGAQPAGTGNNATYLHDIVYVSSGNRASYAVDANGGVWAWGSNVAIHYGNSGADAWAVGGLLGNNNTTMTSSNTPVRVINGETLQPLTGIIQVDATDNAVYALDAAGNVWAWGNNQNGQLGNGSDWVGGGAASNYQYTARRVKKGTYLNGASTGSNTPLDGIVQITAGDTKGMFLDYNGNVWGVGSTYDGIGGFTGGGGAAAVYAARINSGNSTAVTGDALYLAGVDAFVASQGAIAATQIGSAAVVSQVKPDGTTQGFLYTFGENYTYAQGTETGPIGGQLGQGTCAVTKSLYPTPTLVTTFMRGATPVSSANINVIGVSDGDGVIYVITQDPATLAREIFVMGANNQGQLGQNNTDATYCRPQLLTLPCALSDPCPEANISQDSIQFCGTLKDTLIAPGQAKSYNYKWTYYSNPAATTGGVVTNKTFATDGAKANQFIVDATSSPASGTGKYVVEVIRPGLSCDQCPIARDSVYVLAYPATFQAGTPASANTYCTTTGKAKVLQLAGAAPSAEYTWYAAATGNTIVGTSVGNGVANLTGLTGTTVYVEETGSKSGVVAPLGGTNTYSTSNSNNQTRYSRLVVYEDVVIDSLRFGYLINTNTAGSYNTPLRISVFGENTTSCNILGPNLAGGALKTSASFTPNITWLANNPIEVRTISVPVNFTLKGSTQGTVYWLGFTNTTTYAPSNGNSGPVQLNGTAFPYNDNLGGKIIKFTQTDLGGCAGTNSGIFHNIYFKSPQKFCNRIAVPLTLNCPCQQPATVTASSLPAGTLKTVTVCAGTAVSLSGLYTPGTNPLTNSIQHVWYKKQGAVGAYAPVPVVGRSLTGVAADNGVWVLRVEDGSAGTASCYKEDSVRVVVTAIPLAPTGTNPPDFCENTTVPVWTAAAATNNTLQWYTVATLGIASATAPVITNTPSGVRTAWVSQKTSTATGGCEGPRLALTTNVIPLPVAPTGTDPADFCENGTPSVWAATALSGNSLQWYTAATNGTLSTTIPTITNTPSGIRNIWVSQKTAAGCEGPRLALKTNVIAAPAPPVAGTNSNFCEGATAPTWNATALSGSSLLWYTAATGGVGNATNPTITNTAGVKNIWVSQKLTSAAGCESTRTPLTLTATPRTVITKQPKDTTLCEGTALSLVASGTGTGTVSYVWKKGTATVGTNNRILSIATAAATDAGAYTVDVTSTCGTVTSNTVNVTINTKPVITTQPTDKGGCVGSSNSLSVVATGTPAPTFAWTPIGSGTGGTTSTLSFASLKATDAGNYTVEVKNSCATVTSNIAKVAITLNETPAVTLATSISQACGDGTKTVVLTAGASGGGSAPTFTFKENNVAISPVAQTANTFTYTIPANATTAVQTLKFTVDMVSNTACLAPAPASFNVSGTATDFKVDPQVTATIANINETKLTICEQTRNLTAATLPANFTHTWTSVGGGANVSATGALTNIAFGGSTKTTYKVESPLKLCPSAEDTVTTVTAGKLTNPDTVVALNNDKICETASAPLLKGLTGLLPGEAGTWSVPAGATNTVTPAGQTGALQVGLNRFIYTIKSSTAVAPCDIDTALVTINIEKQPDAADAGADKKTCASTYTLGATAVTNGIGTWTPASAFTGDRTLFNAVATLVDNQANEFTWTVSNGVGAKCADKTDKVIITQAGKITSASPVASQSKPICSTDAAPLLNTTGVAVLKSEESAAWVAKAPATINTSTGQTAGLVVGDNTFQYIITTTVPGCDPDTGTVVIKAIAPPVASITAPVSVQTVLPSFTANNAHTQKDLDVVVTAGTVAAGYTGAWTVTKAPNSTVPAITTTTTATIKDMGKFDDQTTVVWTVKDNTLPAAVCPSAVATLVITRKDFTVSNPKDTVICESAIAGGFIVTGNVAQADNLEGVKWTALDGGTITYLSPDSSRIRVTGLPSPTLDSANYRFEYTITNKVLGNASTNTATVKVYKNSSIPVISTNSGNDITMCGSDQQLDIQATVAGRITWTNNKSLTFNNATTSSTLISGFTNTTGTVDVTVSVKNGTCPIETDNIKIIRSGELTSPTPTVDNDSSCVASTVNLSGKTPLATNLETSNWKVSPTSGVTLNTTIDVAAATATFSATGTYVFTYEIDNPTCPEKKQTVTVVVADKPATGTVTGTDPTCEEGTGTYTATGFTSTLPVTYAWTSTPSATSTATTTDAKKQSVTYTFKSTNPTAATDNATVDVIAKNACGTASGSKAVSYGLKPRVFDVPGGPITGSTQFCSTKPTTQPYTVGGSVQATKYNWKWNTQALSGTTTSNNLTDIIWGTATSGTLEVVLENACGVGTFATAKTSIAITIDQPVAFEADITSNAPDQKFCVPQAGVTYTASSIPLTVTPTGYTFSTSSSAVTQTDVALKTWLPAVDVVKDLGKVKVTITASDDPLNANFACLKNYTATDSIIMDGYKYPDSLIVSSVDTICDNQSDIVLSVNRSLNGSNKFNDNDQPRWFLNDTLAQPQFDGRFSINLGDANQSGIWKVKIPGSICSTHVSADTHRVKIYEQPDFLFAENPMVVVYQDGITKRMPVVLVSPARDSITKTTWTNETWLEYPLNDTLNALFVPKREQVELEYSLILRTGAAKFNCTTEKPLVVINALPLNIPNAFSPNGDGVNDTWVINGLIKYSSVTVSVFNRWGNKVFYSTGAYTPWDGAVNGIPVSSGTYYAIVELKGSPDGTDDNVSKALTIVR